MWIAKALDILTPKAGFTVCDNDIDKIAETIINHV